MKNSLLGLSLTDLEKWFTEKGHPRFRAEQVYNAVFARRLDDIQQIRTLPQNLRDELQEHFYVRSFNKLEELVSPVDKTRKFLWQLRDGYKIESVVIYEGKRTTFCISSQIGCALDCEFCATGKMGILRNLTSGEILEQVILMSDAIGDFPTNIVYMGMGEPMLNYDTVIKSAGIMSEEKGINLSPRKITISTSGVLPAIYRMADEQQPFSLALSLNSVDQAVRERIMPISKKYPIDVLLEGARYYTEKMKRMITFEYVLIDGVNSSPEDARELVRLTHRIPCKINVIPCNSTDPEYPPPPAEKIRQFEEYVNEHSRRITIRKRKGWEIQAACGQLYAANERKRKSDKLNV